MRKRPKLTEHKFDQWAEDLKAWIRILEAIRAYLGPDFPLGVDFHWKLNTRDALRFVDMARHLNLWFV